MAATEPLLNWSCPEPPFILQHHRQTTKTIAVPHLLFAPGMPVASGPTAPAPPSAVAAVPPASEQPSARKLRGWMPLAVLSMPVCRASQTVAGGAGNRRPMSPLFLWSARARKEATLPVGPFLQRLSLPPLVQRKAAAHVGRPSSSRLVALRSRAPLVKRIRPKPAQVHSALCSFPLK
ncbi:hypothetical protein D1007_55547 [Hordeum vulgare]|nr:hypothetical protein D1007_55547 [Hordeum vulgare]